ncbi:MAG TPA: ATP-dependent DNA ligase [Steroidobacteraceae bacterium]|jgi:DNA ligase-1|nr:ATP-dependent DNA ligase [Steroidobacteraceae bacterium]
MASLASVALSWQRVGATASRGAKVSALAQCLRTIDETEIELAVHYLAGELPQGKLGVGYAVVQQAAMAAAAPLERLSLTEVDQCFTELLAVRGAGAAQTRTRRLAGLFGQATALEQRFLMRLLVGELRAGALTAVMLEAVAAAAGLPVTEVRRAAMYAAGVGAVARAALTGGSAALAAFELRTLAPLEPMLAQTATGVTDALARLGGEVALEYKIDGARIQLHKRAGEVRIFTHRLNDVAASLPEIVELARTLPAHELVLDGEAVALNASGRARPFQQTMRRFGRKLDVEVMRRELPLHAYFFDCLRLEQQSLADRPARERFAALVQAVPAPYRIERLIGADEPLAAAFYARALAAGHEGVMAKALDAAYEAGSRGASWLKIKHVHTLDLVVLAAEWGHGRRTGWLSNLHLGARNGDDVSDAGNAGGFVMLGKTFKGLTDETLRWQTEALLALERARDAMTVYVQPRLVVEIAFNDIQASSQYPGGLALRFARVKRYRDDKSPVDADTIDTVRALYQAQTGAI